VSESKIITGAGGTVFAGPDATNLFRAATLKAALGLLAKGITPTRGLTITRALAMVKEYSGKTYKRSQIEEARRDLTTWIEAMKSALPVEDSEEKMRDLRAIRRTCA
jgi:hypothetical protein